VDLGGRYQATLLAGRDYLRASESGKGPLQKNENAQDYDVGLFKSHRSGYTKTRILPNRLLLSLSDAPLSSLHWKQSVDLVRCPGVQLDTPLHLCFGQPWITTWITTILTA
jgi:hypothetical protein